MAKTETVSVDEVKKVDEVSPEVAFARKRQQLLRKEAPKNISVGRMWKSPFDRKVEMYATDCVGKNRSHDGFWGDPTMHKERLNQGYEPVMVDGQQVREGQMILYKRPIEFLTRELKAADNMSRERIKTALDDQSKSDGLQDATVDIKNGQLGA